jgi:hypothetical protein
MVAGMSIHTEVLFLMLLLSVACCLLPAACCLLPA